MPRGIYNRNVHPFLPTFEKTFPNCVNGPVLNALYLSPHLFETSPGVVIIRRPPSRFNQTCVVTTAYKAGTNFKYLQIWYQRINAWPTSKKLKKISGEPPSRPSQTQFGK
jgi:hypothetical protein